MYLLPGEPPKHPEVNLIVFTKYALQKHPEANSSVTEYLNRETRNGLLEWKCDFYDDVINEITFIPGWAMWLVTRVPFY